MTDEVVTDAIVLHVAAYLESSVIVRIATREAGIRSAIARGARRSKRRFGSSLQLFTGGSAHLQIKPNRDLDTLVLFEPTNSRAALGSDLHRFSAASTIAELALRFGGDDADDSLFEAVQDALDQLSAAQPGRSTAVALAAAWRMVSALGFAPTTETCANCHETLSAGASAPFNHRVGGVICPRCTQSLGGSRRLPAEERERLTAWLRGEVDDAATALALRAHQRLLREFLLEHLADHRPLQAYALWENARLAVG